MVSQSSFGDMQEHNRLVPGTLRGFRQWHLQFNDEDRDRPAPHITSINGSLWRDGKLSADCTRKRKMVTIIRANGSEEQQPSGHEGDPPDGTCGCGIYAFHYHHDWEKMDLARHYQPTVGWITVSGVIKASGRIIVGTMGFRAQHAEIEAISISMDKQAMPDSLFQRAMVAVVSQLPDTIPVYGNKVDMWNDFPPDDLTGLFGAETAAKMKEESDRVHGHAPIVVAGTGFATGGPIVPANQATATNPGLIALKAADDQILDVTAARDGSKLDRLLRQFRNPFKDIFQTLYFVLAVVMGSALFRWDILTPFKAAAWLWRKLRRRNN